MLVSKLGIKVRGGKVQACIGLVVSVLIIFIAISLIINGAQTQSVQIFSDSQGKSINYNGYSTTHDFSLGMSTTKTLDGSNSLSLNGIKLTSLDDTYELSADNAKSLTVTVQGIPLVSPSYTAEAQSGQNGCGMLFSPKNIEIPIIGGSPPLISYNLEVSCVRIDSNKPVTLTVTATRPIHTDSDTFSTSLDISGFPQGVYSVTQGGAVVARIYVGETPPSSYTLNLYSGWNLISIPIQPENNQISYIFSPQQQQNIDVIWAYNGGSANPWQYWTTEDPWRHSNTLTTLSPYNGYWIYCYNDMSVTIYGSSPPSPKSLGDLASEWNLIGCPSTSGVSISGNYASADVIWKYDRGTWSYYTTEPDYAESSTISSIEPGFGYWIYKI